MKIEYGRGKKFYRQFDDDKITIGNSATSNLYLPLKGPRGLQVLIQKTDNVLQIVRLNKEAHVKLNGEEFELQQLNNKDVFSIDKFKISILDPEKDKKIKNFEETYRSIGHIETKEVDKKLNKSFIISLFVSLLFLFALSYWDIPKEVQLEDLPDRFSRLIIDPVVKSNEILTQTTALGDGAGEGARSAGEAGARGDPGAKIETKALREIVRAKGVLGVLNTSGVKQQLSAILEEGVGFGKKFTETFNNNNAGASDGQKVALYKGTFGTALEGVGTGGGGTSKDVVGGLSTKGKGGGVAGYGLGSVGQKGESVIEIDEVNTIVKGSLDRSEIEAVIKKHLAQIRYCYEKELKTQPNLSGKVISTFIIGANGDVTSSEVSESTIKNSSVETCISRRIANWIFPKPKGNGIVIVKYPFIFRSLK
jgi:hypothetical protein